VLCLTVCSTDHEKGAKGRMAADPRADVNVSNHVQRKLDERKKVLFFI
jgi:hypothetical protein